MRDYRGAPLELTPEQKKRIKRRQDRERVLALSEHDRDGHRPSHGDSKEMYGSGNEADDDDEPIEIVRPADPELRALVVNFFKTFQGASMRDSVFGLDIAGMIDHTEGEYKGHCSILYRLPSTIGIQSRERPAENLKLRAPMTLQSLLGDAYIAGIRSMLGARFELARKLVRAVCMLHSSGWLHKNIRAESVIFFPEHVSALQEDRYEVDIELDVSQPILMGYIFSRPDDIVQRLPRSTQQADDLSDDSSEGGRGPDKCHMSTSRVRDRVATVVYDLSKVPRNKRMGIHPARSIYGHNASEIIGQPEEMRETNISGFTLDYYQHPAKHADPQRLYRHAYDIYSLGILLLEIGLWRQLRIREKYDNDDGEDHYERRREICRYYLPELRWTCGDIYANVVLRCLMIDCSDEEAAMASERELCAKIVADLEGCRA
jgi:hypothetical protein